MSSLSDWYNAPKSDRGANQTVSKPSSSSGSSSSSSSRSKVGVGMPAIPSTTGSSGMINPPMASGGTAAPYQVDGVTYTPGPTNWDSMSQSQRDAYGRGISGGSTSSNGGSYPPMPQQSNGGIWAPVGQNQKITAGMGMGLTPPPMPATGGTTPFPVKTPEAIAAEAKARTDALLAKQTTIAGQTKQGFNTAYDRLKATTKDDRTLADAAFQRNTNPFSGSTGNQRDMTGRQRTIEDSNAQQDLQTRLANVDLSLADYTNATEAQRMQMETDMTNAERAYGMQVDQLALQRRGQEQSQLNADRQFNYGVGRDAVVDSRYNDTTQYNQGRDNVLDNRYVDTTNYNRGRDTQNDTIAAGNTAYNQGRDRISDETKYNGIYNPSGLSYSQVTREFEDNSAAYANASPEQKQKLHERNLYLGSLIGKQYDTGTGEYSQGNNFVGTPTLEARRDQFNQGVTLAELTFKQDSYKQKFNEDVRQFDLKTALDEAFRNDQLTLQQYNAATSRMSANSSAASAASSAGNAAARLAWDMNPNNPDNLYKQSEIAKNNAPKPKTANSYKTDPNFAADVAHIKSNKEAKSQLDSNAQPFIDEYGYDGYVELRKAAGLN